MQKKHPDILIIDCTYCGGVEGVVHGKALVPQAPTPPLSRRSHMTWLRYINGYFVATHTHTDMDPLVILIF
jgi:hypothetical protein